MISKIVCGECGHSSYDENEFEFCIYCGVPMCDTNPLGCITYEFVDGLDEPVCKKCKNEE